MADNVVKVYWIVFAGFLIEVSPSRPVAKRSTQLTFQRCASFLWYSPISKTQTLEDCLLMRETKSPFYPSYCDRLLRKYHIGVETTTMTPFEMAVISR